MPPAGGAGHTTNPSLGVHKPAVKLLRNKSKIKINQSADTCIDLYLIIYYIRPSLLFFTYHSTRPDLIHDHPLQGPPESIILPLHITQTKMFQQRAAQRLLTTLRPHVARRMIATQPSKAIQATVSKTEFFTTVIAFSGATGVILACVTSPSSSSS
jgi:hypothetical protein